MPGPFLKIQSVRHANPVQSVQPLLMGARLLAVLSVAVGLQACSVNQPKFGGVSDGLHCVDDSSACIDQRQFALRTLLADSKRSWIGRPPSPEAYAAGVRLFAFKKQKKVLSCDELSSGIREASNARASLRSASERLTTGQIARGAMLGDEVSRELAREKMRRCKRG